MILGAKYVKASECSTGDIVKFLTEGKITESTKYTYQDGNPQRQYQFEVEMMDGTSKIINLNKASRDNLSTAWGNDTSTWIGRKAEMTITDCMVAGQMKKVIVLKPVEQIF